MKTKLELTCLLVTKGGDFLRRPLAVHFHVVLADGASDDAHALGRRGEGELTDDANFKRVLR